MITYEVNLTIDPEIAEDYEHWLKSHILQVLDSPGFKDAKVFEVQAMKGVDPTAAKQKQLVVQYRVETKDDLESYLMERAPRLREEALDEFGDQFSATRRVLQFQYQSEQRR